MNNSIPSQQQSSIIRVVAVHDADDAPCVEALKLQLIPALRSSLLSFWHGGEIQPGEDVEDSTSRALRSAQVLLLFVSPRFNERYYDRLLPLLIIGNTKQRRIVPVHARRCSWRDTPFIRLQYLPRDGEPLMLGSQLDEERVRHLADELLNLVEQVKTEPRDDLSVTKFNPQVTASLLALMKEVIVFERQQEVMTDTASGSTADAPPSGVPGTQDHRSLVSLQAEFEAMRAENRALAAQIEDFRKEQATSAIRLESHEKELNWLRTQLRKIAGLLESQCQLDGRNPYLPATDLSPGTPVVHAQSLFSQPGEEPAPYVVARYLPPTDTAFFHFLYGMVPGHGTDFIFLPEALPGALTHTHFGHLARLVRHVEPRKAGSYAFTIGNLSRDDAQHEPGHGGLAILFASRVAGIVGDAERDSPLYAIGVFAADRHLDYVQLLEATTVLHQHFLERDGMADRRSDRYRAYVRLVQEQPNWVEAFLAQWIGEFDDIPHPPDSTLGFDFIRGTKSLPNEITIVHDDNEPFAMLAHYASLMASALYCSNIKWTSITNGLGVNMSGGTTVRFVPRSEISAGVCDMYLIDDLPEDEEQLLTLLFSAKRRVG